MPDRLKSILVDDWENVTKQLQLVSLPAKFPASVILDEYFTHATGSGMRTNAEIDILQEVIHGLKEYFNKALGRLLLYRFEREQFFDIYTQINQPTGDLAGKAVADIYGGEHLLRLFGKLHFCPAPTLDAPILTGSSLDARTHCANQYGCPGC